MQKSNSVLSINSQCSTETESPRNIEINNENNALKHIDKFEKIEKAKTPF